MTTPRLLLLALSLLLLGSPRLVAAQDAAAELEVPTTADEAATSAPGFRLDFVGPSFGLGHFAAPAADYGRGFATIGGDVRLVAQSGHGAMVRVAHGTNVWGGATAFELDYVFRARAVGDDRFGLGIDLSLGGTAAAFSHDEGTLPSGLALGGNAGVSIDFRAYNFVVSLGAQYRLMLPTEGAANGGATGPEHAFTGTLGLGFGFWGA